MMPKEELTERWHPETGAVGPAAQDLLDRNKAEGELQVGGATQARVVIVAY